jgi:hypothetical protein
LAFSQVQALGSGAKETSKENERSDVEAPVSTQDLTERRKFQFKSNSSRHSERGFTTAHLFDISFFTDQPCILIDL